MNGGTRYPTRIFLALLVLALGVLLASDQLWQRSSPTPNPGDDIAAAMAQQATLLINSAVPHNVPEAMIHTGDIFWGLHFSGVVPVPTVLGQGGGNYLTFTRLCAPYYECSYYIRKDSSKEILLGGVHFMARVTGEDEVHVAQVAKTLAASP